MTHTKKMGRALIDAGFCVSATPTVWEDPRRELKFLVTLELVEDWGRWGRITYKMAGEARDTLGAARRSAFCAAWNEMGRE